MKEYLNKLDSILSEYLVKKAPVLPADIKTLLVKLAPFFAILTVVLGIPAFLAIFSLGAVLTPFAWLAGGMTGTFWFFWAVGIVQMVLAGLSIKPLFAHAGHGWRLMFYSQLVSIVTSLNHINLFSLALSLLSLYLLYQVKASYKK